MYSLWMRIQSSVILTLISFNIFNIIYVMTLTSRSMSTLSAAGSSCLQSSCSSVIQICIYILLRCQNCLQIRILDHCMTAHAVCNTVVDIQELNLLS